MLLTMRAQALILRIILAGVKVAELLHVPYVARH